MIKQHEIPNGSKLYFGESAKLKRDIENIVSSFFYDKGFEEIVSPNFSYSLHQSIEDEKKLILISDKNNHQVALRADSTLDIVRIITKRLGRTTNHKKWFYIQPVFTYPSNEYYQIGCEWINHNNIYDILNLLIEIFKLLNIKPSLQVSNINIVKFISKYENIDINLFKYNEIDALYKLDIKWLNNLIDATNKDDIDLSIMPSYLKDELEKLLDLDKLDCDIIFSPLYYSSMKYYNSIFFRATIDNYTISKGGSYTIDDIESMGFALYLDNILKIIKG